MKIAPCKDCPNRAVGCHAVCAEYQAFATERAEYLRRRNLEISVERAKRGARADKENYCCR